MADEQQGVEAEAMRPADLRAIVADAFEPMLDRRRLELLRTVEAAERAGQRRELRMAPLSLPFGANCCPLAGYRPRQASVSRIGAASQTSGRRWPRTLPRPSRPGWISRHYSALADSLTRRRPASR